MHIIYAYYFPFKNKGPLGQDCSLSSHLPQHQTQCVTQQAIINKKDFCLLLYK